MRSVLAASALVLLAAVPLAGPAHADPVRGGITSPGEGAVLDVAAPRLSASFAHSGGEITSVRLELTSERTGQTLVHSVRGDGRSAVAVEWAPQLTHNGPYRLVAVATGRDQPFDSDGDDVTRVSRSFALAAPPAAPRDVVATVGGPGDPPRVSWEPNAEPDLIGYQVERAEAGGDDFRPVGITTAPRFTDTTADPGRFSYRVIAVRQGATEDDGVASSPSEPSRAVEVRPQPTTTTAAPPAERGAGEEPRSPGASTPSRTGTTAPARAAPPVARTGKVDLSGFRQLLARNTAPAPEAGPLPDPGYQETLPFDASDEPAEDATVAPAGQMEIALGEPLASGDDDSERRRSLAFIAGGLLAFVLMMGTVFVRGEVRRYPDAGLDAVDAP